MASPLLCLLLVTACAAELGFQPKQQYKYAYEATQASGIPSIDSQWSALGLKMTVRVQVPTEGNLYVKLEDIKYGEMHNQKTHQPWRKSLPISYQSNSQFEQYLTAPFKVIMQQGIVERIVTSEEPIWVGNVKKSIAQLFQLDMQQRRSIQETSAPQPLSYGAQKLADSGNMFRVMEDSIGGECETIYQTTRPLNESLEADILQELRLMRDPPVQVPETREFQPFYVLKTKNYQHCRRRPVWQHMTPPAVACRSDDCHLTASNSSATARYLLDGDSQDFRIQAVVAESESLVCPYGHETGKLWTVTNQTLFLVSAERMGHFMGEPRPSKTYDSLEFQYPTADGQQLQFPDLKSEPQMSTVMPGVPIKMLKQQFGTGQIKNRIKELVAKVDNFMQQVPQPQSQDIPSLIIEIERALSLLSYDEISSVYQSIQNEKQIHIFIDALATVGTNPAVTYIADRISSSHVTPGQASSVISTLPLTIKTPTPELVEKLISLLKSSPIQENQNMRTTTTLALANIFHQVCVSNVTVDFSYPNAVYSQRFCNEKMMSLLKGTMIPYLQQKIQSVQEPEKLVYIQALGNIGHKSVISSLANIFTSVESTPQTASRAIYALHYITKEYPETVRKLVMPIFSDYTKKIEVRVAALITVLHCNLPIAYWQEIATSTWFEPSEQMVSVIHSAYSSLANITNAQVQPLFEMSRRARMTFPLVRPPSTGAVDSSSYSYVSELIPHYQLAVIDRVSYVTSPESVVPTVIYVESKSYINSLILSNSKVVANIKHVESLIDSMSERYSGQRQSPRDIRSGSQMLRRIVSELKIPELSRNSDFQANIYVQLMGAIDYFFSIDTTKVNELMDSVRSSDYTYSRYQQKIMYLEDKTATFPSEIGMPVIYVKKVPLVASVRGEMSASWNYHEGHYDVSFKDVKPFVACKSRVLVTTVSPWSLCMLGVGVENNFQLGLPISLGAKVDTQTKTVHINGTLTQPSVIPLVHYDATPFTTAIRFNDYVPMTASPDTKEIFAHEPAAIKIPFGSSEGIRGYLSMVQDSPVLNFGTIYSKFIGNGSPQAQFSFSYLMSSLHSRHYDVVIDVANSQTQSFVSTFVYADKTTQRQPISPSNTQSREHMREISQVIQSAQNTMRQSPLQDYNVCLACVISLKQRAGNNIHYKSYLTWAADEQWYDQKLHYQSESSDSKVCLDTTLNLPRLSEKRQSLLNAQVRMPLTAKLGFGSTCQEHRVQMSGYAERDQQQRDYAVQCPQAQRCQQHERANNPNSADCRIAKEHAAMVNVLNMDFTWQNLPQKFRNSSYQLDYVAKYLFWPYMTNDPYKQNTNEKLSISVRYNPFSNIAAAHVHKPFETTKFEDIELRFNPMVRPILLSLRSSFSEKVADAIYGVDKTVCIADIQALKTFDNVTMSRRPSSECWTLLAKDINGTRQIAVLDKLISGHPAVSVLADEAVVEIQARGSSFQMTVNGRPQTLSPGRTVQMPGQDGRPLMYIEQMSSEHVIVYLPRHSAQVLLSSEGVQLSMSPLAYRNRLTGICGSMDAEVQDDMVGPQGCIFKRSEDFIKAFVVPIDSSSQQCRPVLPNPNQCVRKPAFASQQSYRNAQSADMW